MIVPVGFQMFSSNGELSSRTMKRPPLPSGGGMRRSPQRLPHLKSLAVADLNGVEEESEDDEIATVEGQTMRNRQRGKRISLPYTV